MILLCFNQLHMYVHNAQYVYQRTFVTCCDYANIFTQVVLGLWSFVQCLFKVTMALNKWYLQTFLQFQPWQHPALSSFPTFPGQFPLVSEEVNGKLEVVVLWGPNCCCKPRTTSIAYYYYKLRFKFTLIEMYSISINF